MVHPSISPLIRISSIEFSAEDSITIVLLKNPSLFRVDIFTIRSNFCLGMMIFDWISVEIHPQETPIIINNNRLFSFII